jgi:iron complex transport system substrate-binding protein
MKHCLLSLVLLAALMQVGAVSLAAQDATPEAAPDAPVTYQVPGFPAFSPAPTMLELIEDRGETVLVRHQFGEVEIPRNPQRIFAATSPEVAVSLGLPVVSAVIGSWETIPEAYEQALANTEVIDWSPELNYEYVLSQQPDLILMWDFADDPAQYEVLSEIAPTLSFMSDPYIYWKEATRDLAAVLGLEARYEQLMSGFDEQIEANCARIRDVVGDGTLNIMTTYEGNVLLAGPVWEQRPGAYLAEAATSWAYRDCQLVPGAEVAELVGVQGAIQLSFERLPALQADFLLVSSGRTEMETVEELTAHPLWQALPAVRNDNAYVMPRLSALGYFTHLATVQAAADVIAPETASDASM